MMDTVLPSQLRPGSVVLFLSHPFVVEAVRAVVGAGLPAAEDLQAINVVRIAECSRPDATAAFLIDAHSTTLRARVQMRVLATEWVVAKVQP